MESNNTSSSERYPCFNLDDPIEFRTCLCERGIAAYCEGNTTSSGENFWEWGRVDYSGKHVPTVKNVVVQRRDYENNSTQSWGLFMILMGIFPIGVLFVCFFACNYRRRWVSRSSLASRPWPSGNILEAGRATPASLASAELEPLVSSQPAPLVSPETPAADSPPRDASASSGNPGSGQGHTHRPMATEHGRAGSPAPSEGPEAAAARARLSGPPPSYSQTLLDVEPPAYEAVCGENEGEHEDVQDETPRDADESGT